MKAPQIAAAFAVVCMSLWSSGALAETKRQERVSVTGCAYAGVTANCLMIKSPTGTVYNITAITPRPRQIGRMIRVRGSVTDKMSICGEGVVLDRIRWTRTRQQCPN
ncbi:MAG TPA: hypothetical protein VFB68_01295 [Xanthobacteraceae bacterium]|nr:hypothetical protein [Xanthobacteraceae bacterium]